jgi:general secretion pathway protein E
MDEFAEFLVQRGRLSRLAVDRVLKSAEQTRDRFVFVLSKLGLLGEGEIVAELSAFYNVPGLSAAGLPPTALYPGRLNPSFLSHHRVLPIREEQEKVAIAMADPGDEAAVNGMRFFLGKEVLVFAASLTDIENAIKRLYSGEVEAVPEAHPDQEDQVDADAGLLSDLASEAPIIRLVNGLMLDAVEAGASDIHIEPFIDRVRIRFRLDGLLQERMVHPKNMAAAIVSRVKVMAHLNIAERRLPQDGRIRFPVRGRDVDFRVSTNPTVHGESVVLRVLDRGKLTLDFKTLGFETLDKQFLKFLERPHGILLVTGPTGSGKTTTLYAALAQLNSPQKKILAIEDPVEYQLEGVNQQQVQNEIGRTFSSALRSFLRQDPDIIMVGEIRDQETAQIAVQAALTGHLILSTLHTNDAASAMTRLLDMGVPEFLTASTVVGVVAQRLVRCLCPLCRQSYEPAHSLVERLLERDGKATLYRPLGCPACQGTGYRGRTTIAELLEVTDTVRDLVLRKASASEIHKAAMGQGMRTMRQHGIAKALAGETSLEEVLRVTQEA